jgi:asparagine N-glycosylation enzyme membrane subunit Stt3
MSEWSYGHEIQWFARKPVISTPFGTEIDARSLADAAAFFLASDPAAAEALLRRRGVGFVFLASPVEEAALMLPYAPREPAPVAVGYGLERGRVFQIREPFGVLVPSRLFYFDGGWPSGEGAALDAYRLIAESPERVQVLTVTTQRFKLFELVDGARLRVQGADPGAPVAAAILVRTNVGREFLWTANAPSDAVGVATLRIPYATGANGLAAASPCTVIQGSRARQVPVPERAVLAGEEVVATLP